MSVRRLLVLAAFVCEGLAALGVDAPLALVPLGLAFFFAAEFV